MDSTAREDGVVVIGGGFAGLAAAWDLTRRGIPVTVLEADATVGGLAGGYEVGGEILEKFYHHWFNNDLHIQNFVSVLGYGDRIVEHESRTGLYYVNTIFRLSKPTDVLKFKALSIVGRFRLGILALLARRVRNWRKLESVTARDWLIQLGGAEVYRVVWEPLLRGKFGRYAEQISAVWFWNKLCLRGGSRDTSGREVLVYLQGGFLAFAEAVAAQIEKAGGKVLTNTAATGLEVRGGRVHGVTTAAGVVPCSTVIATPALPILADIFEGAFDPAYIAQLRKIEYLANMCLVLELDRPLSDTYWINVNDANFPFVGIIEHTNFESAKSYGGRHVVYLSKYLPADHELYGFGDEQFLNYAVPFIKQIFPQFEESWILRYKLWRADYAQPVVGLHYSQLIPPTKSPVAGVYVATMAQIYPEDRGTNYAVREGRAVAALVAADRAAQTA